MRSQQVVNVGCLQVWRFFYGRVVNGENGLWKKWLWRHWSPGNGPSCVLSRIGTVPLELRRWIWNWEDSSFSPRYAWCVPQKVLLPFRHGVIVLILSYWETRLSQYKMQVVFLSFGMCWLLPGEVWTESLRELSSPEDPAALKLEIVLRCVIMEPIAITACWAECTWLLVNRKTNAETQFVSLVGAVTWINMCIPIPETEFTVSTMAESLVFTNLTMCWVTVLQRHGFGCVKGHSKAPNISLSRKLSFIVFKPCELKNCCDFCCCCSSVY